MKAMLKILTFLLFILPVSMDGQSIEDLVKTGRSQMDRYLEGSALTTFTKVLDQDPNHFEALWRSSILKTHIANRIVDRVQQTTYLNAAIDLAKRALKVNPKDANGYFVLALSMGRMAASASPKDAVAASYDIKTNAEKAVELNPKLAAAWHILGGWNYHVANLNVAERAACNLLFGGLPKGASNEKSLECYTKALTYAPNFIFYMYDIAELYYTMNKKEECKKWLTDAIALKPVTPDDPATQAKCRVLLARCR